MDDEEVGLLTWTKTLDGWGWSRLSSKK
jgi:hypothetical protein